MPTFDLDDQDAALLREVLDRHLADMRYELADTDSSTYKRQLHDRYDRIAAIAAKLPEPPPE